MFGEIGRIGQNRWGGRMHEEFHKDLQGPKGVETYREMSENDAVIGGTLFSIESLIRQARWSVRAGGSTEMDAQCAAFVESCFHDMQEPWPDTLSEALSFLVFGWCYLEIVYKRRMGRSRDPALKSKYNDGLIGWRKLPIRAQETLARWEYDAHDNLVGMVQMLSPEYKEVLIPIEKAIHLRTKSRKGNPEGRSILRNAYRSWYFKRRIQEIEGIGVERDLAGLPVLIAPEGMPIWDASDPEMADVFARAEAIVRNIRRDSAEGIVLPADWKLELLSTGGKRQFDTGAIIERYDARIAMCALADFILLGHQQVGSFALSSDKTELFSMALGAYLDLICEAFNDQAIPRLVQLNEEAFRGITDYPKLVHGDVETPDLDKLGGFVRDMTGCGAITPDEDLEVYLREAAGLPPKARDSKGDVARVE